MICPICETKAKENQDYCLVCAWEFEYFFDELGEEERKRYQERVQIQQELYTNAIQKKSLSENIKKENKQLSSCTKSLVTLLLLGGLSVYYKNGEKFETKKEITTLDNNVVKEKENIISSVQNKNLKKSKSLFSKCVGCHGKNGQINALGKSGIIGGKSKKELIETITAYKRGKGNKYGMGALMKGQVVSFTEEDILNISSYISDLTGKDDGYVSYL